MAGVGTGRATKDAGVSIDGRVPICGHRCRADRPACVFLARCVETSARPWARSPRLRCDCRRGNRAKQAVARWHRIDCVRQFLGRSSASQHVWRS